MSTASTPPASDSSSKQDRPRRFLQAFAAILKHSNYRMALEHHLRADTKCGRCALHCQVFQATGEDRDLPCQRSELLLAVYRRHFTVSGLLRGKLLGESGLTDAAIQRMTESFNRCMGCRRCRDVCPMGIDHSLITHLARYILSEIGAAPAEVTSADWGAGAATAEDPAMVLTRRLSDRRNEVSGGNGVVVDFPIDREGAEYLFLPVVADSLTEAGTLMGCAAVLQATGASWTLASGCYDSFDRPFAFNDRILADVLQAVRSEAGRLKVARIVVGECGDAWRCVESFLPAQGPQPLPVVNIVEYSYRAWKEGRLKLMPGVVEKRVTYHDPCHFVRGGGIVEQPRELLRAICRDFVEIVPNRDESLCCGGGGQLVGIGEIQSHLTVVGRARAEQIRQTGAKYCVAPCGDCRHQLRASLQDLGVDCEVVGLHDLLYQAVRCE